MVDVFLRVKMVVVMVVVVIVMKLIKISKNIYKKEEKTPQGGCRHCCHRHSIVVVVVDEGIIYKWRTPESRLRSLRQNADKF